MSVTEIIERLKKVSSAIGNNDYRELDLQDREAVISVAEYLEDNPDALLGIEI